MTSREKFEKDFKAISQDIQDSLLFVYNKMGVKYGFDIMAWNNVYAIQWIDTKELASAGDLWFNEDHPDYQCKIKDWLADITKATATKIDSIKSKHE